MTGGDGPEQCRILGRTVPVEQCEDDRIQIRIEVVGRPHRHPGALAHRRVRQPGQGMALDKSGGGAQQALAAMIAAALRVTGLRGRKRFSSRHGYPGTGSLLHPENSATAEFQVTARE